MFDESARWLGAKLQGACSLSLLQMFILSSVPIEVQILTATPLERGHVYPIDGNNGDIGHVKDIFRSGYTYGIAH